MKGSGGPAINLRHVLFFLLLHGTLSSNSSVTPDDEQLEEDYQVGRVIRHIVYNDQFDQYRNHVIRPAIKVAEFRHPPQFSGPFDHTFGINNYLSSSKSNPNKPPYMLAFKQIIRGKPIYREVNKPLFYQKYEEPPRNHISRPVTFPPEPILFQQQRAAGCNCVHLVECAAVMQRKGTQGCSMVNGANGICCPDETAYPPWGGITRLFTPKIRKVEIPHVSSEQLNQACHKGVDIVNDIQEVEHKLMRTNNILKRGTPERAHLKFFQITRAARSLHKGAMAISKASESMKREFRLNNEQSCIGLRQFSARNTILSGNCPAPPRCNHKIKYRSNDGTCNNLKHTLYGKSETAFQRILPAKYDDGIRAVRQRSVTGTPLPNPRTISRSVLTDNDKPHPQFTLSVMQWGQIIDHDLAHTPFASFDNNEGKECCKNGKLVTPQLLEDCWPIEIPTDDEFYHKRHIGCMNFIRSMIAEDDDCSFGCAEQMNQVTHWLDASWIYGSTVSEGQHLREPGTGYLKASTGNLLPYQSKRTFDCEATEGTQCFLAGDSRVNEQPGLTAMHIIWLREHNRVARIMHTLNPHWSADAVYQETRRVIISKFQHILYNEWLPIIVGEPFMRSFDIMPKRTGYNLDYNPIINPNIRNEFATAAFRFGHTLVQGTMRLFSRFGRQSTLRLKDHFNSPHLFHRDPEMVNMIARTWAKQNIQSFDSFITKELTNHLFETKHSDFGLDLMSLNIQRGRDHAIATYNEIRVVCGLKRARQFSDLLDQIPSQTVQRMSTVYRHVDDIDLFIGGISERPVAGGLLGWTFLCIVGDQFARAKKGDRFFYDLGGQPGSFKPEQLQEIRKASWARILCENTDIDHIQPLAFRLAGFNNPEVPCNSQSIPVVDLRHWIGERPHA